MTAKAMLIVYGVALVAIGLMLSPSSEPSPPRVFSTGRSSYTPATVYHARAAIKELTDALLWCGNIPEYNPGGGRRYGWERVVLPVLRKYGAVE